LLHATWNALVKTSGDQLLAQATIMFGAGAFGLVLVSQGTFPWEAWPWLLASIVVHTAYLFALVHSYSLGDLSQVYPIARGSAPLLIALLAIPMLGESLSWGDGAGVALISAGIFILATGAHEHPESRRAVLWSLVTGLLIVAYSLLDGIGVRAAPDVFGYVGWLHVGETLPILTYALISRRKVLVPALRRNGRTWFVGGLMAGFGYTIILWAYSRVEIAPVAALRETSVVMAALIGAIRFGEPLGTRRIFASLVVVAGVALLNLQ
jgi:drug/metabolite transporter (DMT)-like permease